MKYKSMGGQIRLASTSGHIILVNDKFIDIPSHMEPDARAKGCISQDVFDKIQAGSAAPLVAAPETLAPETVFTSPAAAKDPVSTVTPEQRIASMVENIKKMAETDAEKNFTNAGLPNLRILQNAEAEKIITEEFDKAWEIVQSQLNNKETS